MRQNKCQVGNILVGLCNETMRQRASGGAGREAWPMARTQNSAPSWLWTGGDVGGLHVIFDANSTGEDLEGADELRTRRVFVEIAFLLVVSEPEAHR